MKRDKYYGLSPRIAVWKIDNIIENWLSYKADHSEIWTWIYVSYYRYADRKYYQLRSSVICPSSSST